MSRRPYRKYKLSSLIALTSTLMSVSSSFSEMESKHGMRKWHAQRSCRGACVRATGRDVFASSVMGGWREDPLVKPHEPRGRVCGCVRILTS